MVKELWPENIIEDEQPLLEHAPGLRALVREDVLAPHAEELPALELLEEGQLLDVVVAVSLDQPVAQSDKLNWTLSQVQSDSLSRECVVSLLISLMILANEQVVRIAVRVRIKIYEH